MTTARHHWVMYSEGTVITRWCRNCGAIWLYEDAGKDRYLVPGVKHVRTTEPRCTRRRGKS